MKQLAIVLSLLPVTALAQYRLDQHFLQYKNLSSGTDAGFTYENLRLYPIIAKDSFKLAFEGISRFTSLKDALAQSKIAIQEAGGGGSVNNLIVENLSSDTIILNCGEVIKGGKQDRVINTDLVLYPHSGKKTVPVFCVEQGRWAQSQDADGSNFKAYYNYSAMSLRKVVSSGSGQGMVWQKVAELNSKNQTGTSTGTYTALDSSKTYRERLQRYTDYFRKKLGNVKDLVGVIVVTGDKVIGVDIFANNDLFKSNMEGLLHSYATEAIIDGKEISVSQQDVDRYMQVLLDESKQAEMLKTGGSSLNVGNKKLKISSFN